MHPGKHVSFNPVFLTTQSDTLMYMFSKMNFVCHIAVHAFFLILCIAHSQFSLQFSIINITCIVKHVDYLYYHVLKCKYIVQCISLNQNEHG